MMKFVVAAAVVGLAAARCPNDCSGHGTCGASDMCTCQRNWMAADCSERVCPFGLSFVDTPQGDLDGDSNVEKTMFHTFDGVAACGDTDDTTDFNNWCYEDANSWGVLAITRDDRKLSATGFDFGCFGSSTTGQAQSTFCEGVSKGDMITIEGTTTANGRNNDGWFIVEQTNTCLDQGMNPNCVKSNADKPSPYGVKTTLNTNYKQQASISTWIIVEDHRGEIPTSLGATTHRFHGDTGVETLQDESSASATITVRGHPVQWSNQLESEYYPHDAQEDEAHFYAECSNKGHCNRKTGECECLAGYEGVGCERTACPEGCSGHGVCEALADLVHGNDPYALWDGTNVPKTYGCVCDARWSGPDCASRVCPVGDDPLTTGQIDEVQRVDLTSKSGWTPYGSFSLYFTDEFGEVWRTSEINARAYVAATERENCVFNYIARSVTCDDGASGDELTVFDDEDFITISGTTASSMQYPDSANDGEFRVFDPKTTNVRTESVSTTSGSPDTHTIIFAEGTVFVDYDEAADSTFDSFDENPSDKKVTFKRSNGLKTALLNLPNDVIEDVSVSIDDASNKAGSASGISYLVTFTANPGHLPEMICDNSLIAGDVNSFSASAFQTKIAESSTHKISFEAPDKIKLTLSTGTSPNFIDTDGDDAYTYETAFRDSDHILVTGTQKNDGVYEIAHSPKAVTSTQLNVRQAVRDEDDEDSTAEAVIYRQQCQVRSELKRVGFFDATTYKTAGSANGDTDSDCSDLAIAVASAGANDATYQRYTISAGDDCDLTKFDIGDQLTIECANGNCANDPQSYNSADTLSWVDGKHVTVTNKATAEGSLTVLAGSRAGRQLVHGSGVTDKRGDGDDTLIADSSQITGPFFVTNYGYGTKEQISCSGRGLCDGGSGVCACFKGFTGDDCGSQNALAM